MRLPSSLLGFALLTLTALPLAADNNKIKQELTAYRGVR